MTTARLNARFRAQVADYPQGTAVSDQEVSLTYVELDERSDRVARALRSDGAERQSRVALLCGHSVDAIVSMLGAIKAGCCIVPLNCHEADGLLETLWAKSDSVAILADAENAGRAEGLCGRADLVVNVSTLPKEEGGARVVLGEGGPASDLLAIIYTSGSTAEPKGTMTTARAVLARADQYQEVSEIGPASKQASITPWHFAAAFPEVYGALLAGAELCLYDAHSRGVEGLGEWLATYRISHLQLPVALLRRFLPGAADHDSAGRVFSDLSFATVAGDRLLRSEAESLLQRMSPKGRVVHAFGSTETNLIAQLELCLSSEEWPSDSEAGYLPVGRPALGKAVHILDESEQPVAEGEEGEIAVESDLISPGYFRLPEETARSFRRLEGDRSLYLTGDVGRIRADGLLEVLGRKTEQVKIRGMRTSTSAAESALLALPFVANAAVISKQDEGGELSLLAFVEGAAGEEVDLPRIKSDLEKRVPSHGIPSRWVMMDALPLTANGKVDRLRLPDPGRGRPALTVDFVAPRTEEEEKVAELWCAQLGFDSVGMNDDFFDLGGDSLGLVRMLSDLEAAEGFEVPVREIEGAPTPAEIAAVLSRSREGKLSVWNPRLEPAVGTFEDRPRAGRRTLRRRIKDQSRNLGPVLGGRALPYSLGMPWHQRMAARLEKDCRFDRFLDHVKDWHFRLELEAPLEVSIRRSVLANSWSSWRRAALREEEAFARWVVIKGAEYVKAAVDSGRGIVLVTTHVGFNALLRSVPDLAGRDWIQIYHAGNEQFGSGAGAESTERARQVQNAQGLLSEGGIATIAADGRQGPGMGELPFFGAQLSVRPGAAALAEAANAVLLPVFGRMETDGRVVFEFSPAIQSEERDADLRIRDCSLQYGERLIAAWPRIFDSLRWHHLRAISL
ncbi:MAG: AMP-binding protein [Myxococcota bacterium]